MPYDDELKNIVETNSRSPRPVAPLTLVESRNKWDCVAVACSFLLECTFDSFPISRGSRCLGLSNYFTDKRFHLLYINGGYYIYIIGVTIGGHTYGQREELQFDFSVAGSHRHRLHQHTHKHTCTCMRSIFTQSTHSAAHNALAVSLRQPHETPKE